jgi:hypothetical protein
VVARARKDAYLAGGSEGRPLDVSADADEDAIAAARAAHARSERWDELRRAVLAEAVVTRLLPSLEAELKARGRVRSCSWGRAHQRPPRRRPTSTEGSRW